MAIFLIETAWKPKQVDDMFKQIYSMFKQCDMSRFIAVMSRQVTNIFRKVESSHIGKKVER